MLPLPDYILTDWVAFVKSLSLSTALFRFRFRPFGHISRGNAPGRSLYGSPWSDSANEVGMALALADGGLTEFPRQYKLARGWPLCALGALRVLFGVNLWHGSSQAAKTAGSDGSEAPGARSFGGGLCADVHARLRERSRH